MYQVLNKVGSMGGVLVRRVSGQKQDLLRTVDENNALIEPIISPSGRLYVAAQQISETLLGASAASFDVQNISQNYKHLLAVLSVRSDAAATTDTVTIAVNNDTALANYDRESLSAAAATVAASETIAAGAATRRIGSSTGATALANSFAQFTILIPDYTNTARLKLIKSSGMLWYVRTTGGVTIQEMLTGWASTAAINRLTFTPTTGPNWVAGSSLSLYGIRAGS